MPGPETMVSPQAPENRDRGNGRLAGRLQRRRRRQHAGADRDAPGGAVRSRNRRDDDAHLVEHQRRFVPGVRGLERRDAGIWVGKLRSADRVDDLHAGVHWRGRDHPASASATLGTATIAGNLLVPTISRSDSDVNDPFAPFAANDDDVQAQVMPNPVVIGGYVNEPNAGPEDGRSFASGDIDDVYRLDLVAGQVIELVIPSALAGGDDADLFLFDSSLELVDSAEGVGQVEQLTVPADGTYFVDVFAFSGAPLYRLSVGQSTVTSNVPGLRLSDDFIPGEVIVTLESAGDPAAKTANSDAILAARYSTSWKGGEPGRAMLLKLPADAAPVASGMTPWSRTATATSKAGSTTTGGAASHVDPSLACRKRRSSSASSTRSSTPSGCAAIPTSVAPTSTA